MALAIWQSHSPQTGTLFTALFLGLGLVTALIAWFLFPLLEHLHHIWAPPTLGPSKTALPLRWAFRDLVRHRSASVTCFLSLSLGVFLLNLIPQIRHTLDEQLQRKEGSKLPGLFFFDIQSEQIEDLKALLAKNGLSPLRASPSVRASLLSVNGRPFDKGEGISSQMSREKEREMRFRNRGLNLSYRKDLDESEKIIKGTHLPHRPGELPSISLEDRFADRLGLHLGDVLNFDVQGLEVQGVVRSIRRVQWLSFQINFFILFWPGALDDAPKNIFAHPPKPHGI